MSIKIWRVSEDIWLFLIVSRAHWTICWHGPNFDGFRCQTVFPWICVCPVCQEKTLWLRKDAFCLFLYVFRWMIDRFVAYITSASRFRWNVSAAAATILGIRTWFKRLRVNYLLRRFDGSFFVCFFSVCLGLGRAWYASLACLFHFSDQHL
jgi:hypothetical protein